MKFKYLAKTSLFLIMSLVIAFGVLAIYKIPNFTYNINSYKSDIPVEEVPLVLEYNQTNNVLKLSVLFKDDVDNSDGAKLITKPMLVTKPPFYTYDYDLIVQLINSDKKSGEDLVYYDIKGEIKGLKTGDYKVKVIDPNNNLVDEKYIVIE